MALRGTIPSQQLSPSGSGYTVLSLCVVVQGNMCHVTLSHGGVQGGTCPKRVASYILQRSRSLQLLSQSVWLQASATNLCLVRGPSQLHQLCCCLLQAGFLAGLLLLTPDLMASPYTPDLMEDWTPSLSARNYLECSAQNFLCDLISGLSYEVLLLPVPLYVLPFGCHL